MATPPDFTSGAVLTAAQMNAVGLWRVASFTSTAGSGTITCADAFNADYDMYRIVIYGGSTSATCNILFQFTGVTTGYYSATTSVSFAAAGVISVNASNTATWDRVGQGTTTVTSGAVDLYGVNGDNKWFSGVFPLPSTTGNVQYSGGYQASIATVTGFALTTSTGTFNANVNVVVYGYRKP